MLHTLHDSLPKSAVDITTESKRRIKESKQAEEVSQLHIIVVFLVATTSQTILSIFGFAFLSRLFS